MINYQNKGDLKKIGKLVKKAIDSTDYYIEDIAFMTGFTRKTIVAIANGSNTDLSHFIELAKALGLHPKEFLDIELTIQPRFKLSPQRQARILLTKKLNKVFNDSDFFDKPKLVSEVIIYLIEEMQTKTDSTKVSVVLKRMVKDGKLSFTKSGRKNVYSKKKRSK